jgi:hypothetical protein
MNQDERELLHKLERANAENRRLRKLLEAFEANALTTGEEEDVPIRQDHQLVGLALHHEDEIGNT